MEVLSVREYRNSLANSFDKADNGEQVLIRRKNQIYALINIGKEDLMITPELQARILEAEHACREGLCKSVSTPAELNNYLDSL